MALLSCYFLRWRREGRELYAYGGNPHAAVYAGIPVTRRLIMAYTLSGLLAGLAGLLWVGRYSIAFTELASGYELTVIAACVIGGVSIGGGVGTIGGALLGVLFIGVINGALPVIQVSPFWQQAIAGDRSSDEDLAHAITLIRNHDAVNATRERARMYAQRAIDAIAGFPASAAKLAMTEAAEFAVARRF